MSVVEKCVNVVLKQNSLHVFRKAINVMKDVSDYVTFQTIGNNTLRLSVLHVVAFTWTLM